VAARLSNDVGRGGPRQCSVHPLFWLPPKKGVHEPMMPSVPRHAQCRAGAARAAEWQMLSPHG